MRESNMARKYIKKMIQKNSLLISSCFCKIKGKFGAGVSHYRYRKKAKFTVNFFNSLYFCVQV